VIKADHTIVVRPFERRDVPEMLTLMRALAVFEGYIDRFRVTEVDLIEYGLNDSPRFGVFVGERDGKIAGIAVHYQIPWTFDMKPTVVLKELFVTEDSRGLGIGRALLDRMSSYASAIGASRIAWTVLPDNAAAKRFYASIGAEPETGWEHWTLAIGE
jgi:GNAT superfamily N-acetyltransferase